MFKVTKGERTFTHDVTIMTAVDGGGFAEDKLKTTFVFLDSTEADAFDLKTFKGTTEFLEKAVRGFHELVDDASGEPLTCTPELKSMLMLRQNVRQAVISHYFGAVAKVKEGN